MLTPEEINFTVSLTERARWYCEEVMLPNVSRLEGKPLNERNATALLLPFFVHVWRCIWDNRIYEELRTRFIALVESPQDCLKAFPQVHKAEDPTTVNPDSARALLVLFLIIAHEPREVTFKTGDLFV